VAFGTQSFRVRGETWGHADTAVLAAMANPLNARYSAVVVAGLGAESTLWVAPWYARRDWSAGEVVILRRGKSPRALVVPARELVCELGEVRATRRE
jgi:hypothetical protein